MHRRIIENQWEPPWNYLAHKTRPRVESQLEVRNRTILPIGQTQTTAPRAHGCEKVWRNYQEKPHNPPSPHTRTTQDKEVAGTAVSHYPSFIHRYHVEPARARGVWELQLSTQHSCGSNSFLKCCSYFSSSVIQSPLWHTHLMTVLLLCADYSGFRIAVFLHPG